MSHKVLSSQNKKVLLRERKRHTARRLAVASACYAGGGVTPSQVQEGGTPSQVWGGYPTPGQKGGTLSQVWGGYPIPGLGGGGYPVPCLGVPCPMG